MLPCLALQGSSYASRARGAAGGVALNVAQAPAIESAMARTRALSWASVVPLPSIA